MKQGQGDGHGQTDRCTVSMRYAVDLQECSLSDRRRLHAGFEHADLKWRTGLRWLTGVNAGSGTLWSAMAREVTSIGCGSLERNCDPGT